MVSVETVTESNAFEYRAFVEKCSCALVQHTLQWRDVIAGIGQDVPCYLIARHENAVVGALPAFLYECEPGNLMISIPQAGGYGGVVIEEDSPFKEEVYAALLTRMIEEAKAHECLLATVCSSPLFGDIPLYREYFKPDFELEEHLAEYQEGEEFGHFH